MTLNVDWNGADWRRIRAWLNDRIAEDHAALEQPHQGDDETKRARGRIQRARELLDAEPKGSADS